MYERLRNGEVTLEELKDEISCLSKELRRDLKKIRIFEPDGSSYTAADIKKRQNEKE